VAKGKITKTTVDSLLPSPAGKLFLWDGKVSGFGVYVTPKGTRGYVLQYRMGGRETPCRRYTIGRHGSPWTPEQARQRALVLLYEVDQGIDPLLAKQRAKAAAEVDEKLRFSVYLETFDKLYLLARRLRSAAEVRRCLRANALPLFGDQPITTITKQQIVGLMDQLLERNKSVALHTFTSLRAMMNFAISRSDLEMSPMQGLKKPHKPARRTRTLNDWELQRVWEAASDMGYPEGVIIQILILMGQRLLEVAHASWNEFDLRDHAWRLPPERTKNKRAHLLPLSEPMLEFFDLHWPAETRNGLLFPRKTGKPVTAFTFVKRRLDAHISRRVELAAAASGSTPAALPHFVLHDLRRTFSTGLRRLGATLETTELILNHVSGTRSELVDTYQLYDLLPEKSLALDRWHRHVNALMSASDAWAGGKTLPPLDFSSKK
jgi:integrase